MSGPAVHTILGSEACGQPWEYRSKCLHNFRTHSSERSGVSKKQFTCAYDIFTVLRLKLPVPSAITVLLTWWSVQSRPKFKRSSSLTEVQNVTFRPTYWQSVEFLLKQVVHCRGELIWAELSWYAWQSPAGKDVSRRVHRWDPSPEHHWWRRTEKTTVFTSHYCL
jgi:hypothetical protein